MATAGRTDDVTRATSPTSLCDTAETLLSALGLQYSSQQPEQPTHSISAIAVAEACTVPALAKRIAATMGTSQFGASLPDDQKCDIDQALRDNSEAVTARRQTPLQRVPPLRLLEHQFRTKTHVAPWRSGNRMAKGVAERKVLVYAILRRLPDPTGASHLILFSDCLQHAVLLQFITHALVKHPIAQEHVFCTRI